MTISLGGRLGSALFVGAAARTASRNVRPRTQIVVEARGSGEHRQTPRGEAAPPVGQGGTQRVGARGVRRRLQAPRGALNVSLPPAVRICCTTNAIRANG